MQLIIKTIWNAEKFKDGDGETFTQPSLVDSSEYESLEQILAKCMRGDFSSVQKDLGGYNDDVKDEDILDSVEPQNRYNFDIVDIQTKKKEALSSLEKDNEKAAAVAAAKKEKELERKSEIEPKSEPKASEKAQE